MAFVRFEIIWGWRFPVIKPIVRKINKNKVTEWKDTNFSAMQTEITWSAKN